MPSKGQFERWDAIGGEYTVSDAGEVSLPFLGSLSVGSLDNASLTNEIGKRLQAKMGLAQTPAVTIDIIDYPSIYVVGDVMAPGEYKFHSGLSVLQSLAMSGGPLRALKHSSDRRRSLLSATCGKSTIRCCAARQSSRVCKRKW